MTRSETYMPTVPPPTRNMWLELHGWALLGIFPNRIVQCLKCGHEETVTGYLTTFHPVFEAQRHRCRAPQDER